MPTPVQTGLSAALLFSAGIEGYVRDADVFLIVDGLSHAPIGIYDRRKSRKEAVEASDIDTLVMFGIATSGVAFLLCSKLRTPIFGCL